MTANDTDDCSLFTTRVENKDNRPGQQVLQNVFEQCEIYEQTRLQHPTKGSSHENNSFVSLSLSPCLLQR